MKNNIKKILAAWLCVVIFATSFLLVVNVNVSSMSAVHSIDRTFETTALSQGREGLVLRVAMQYDLWTLNVIAYGDVWSWHVLKYIYDSPMGTDPITDELIPWIAIRSGNQPDRLFGCDYDPAYTNPEDPSDHYNPRNVTVEYDFTGVKWHDGENVTIDDVLFSTYTCALSAKYTTNFQCLMDLGGVGGSNFTATHWLGITKVYESEDKLHAKLNFKLQVDFALFYRSTLAPFLIPKHIWEQFGDPMLAPGEPGAMDFSALLNWDPRSPSEVVGCGPMKFVEWSPGAFAKSTKYEDFFYHQKPTIDGILYRIYKTTDAATMALKTGEVDLVAWAIPPDYIPDLMNDPNIGISSAAQQGFFYLAFNMRKPDFGYDAAGEDFGKPFRKAVAHCIDKKTIVTTLLQNFGVAADGPVSPANTLWFNDSLPTYAFDVDEANFILDTAGIMDTDGDGWRELPTLDDSRFEMLTPTEDYDPVRYAAGLMIATQMQKAGINVVSKPTAFAQICESIDARAFDMYILGWSIAGLDPDYLYDFFYSGNAEAGQNYPGYNSLEFDELILDSRAEMDETKRVELIKWCQGILVEDLPYDVLYYKLNIEAYRSDRFINWTLCYDTIFNFWSILGIHPPIEISIQKNFLPAEVTPMQQRGTASVINTTNIGDMDITSMTVTDEYVDNMAPSDPPEVLVTITSDEGEVYAIMPWNLTVTLTDSDITISFELPLFVVSVFWEDGKLRFGGESYYLERIPNGWTVTIAYPLYPITELEIGTYTADATVTAYSETGASVTETATGTLIVSPPIEPKQNHHFGKRGI